MPEQQFFDNLMAVVLERGNEKKPLTLHSSYALRQGQAAQYELALRKSYSIAI